MLKLLSSKDVKELFRLYSTTKEVVFRDSIVFFTLSYTTWRLSIREFYDKRTEEDILQDAVYKVLKIMERKDLSAIKYPLWYIQTTIKNVITDGIEKEISDKTKTDPDIFINDITPEDNIFYVSNGKKKVIRPSIIRKFKKYKPMNYFGMQHSGLINEIVGNLKKRPYLKYKINSKKICKDYDITMGTYFFFSRFYKKDMMEFLKGY